MSAEQWVLSQLIVCFCHPVMLGIGFSHLAVKPLEEELCALAHFHNSSHIQWILLYPLPVLSVFCLIQFFVYLPLVLVGVTYSFQFFPWEEMERKRGQ